MSLFAQVEKSCCRLPETIWIGLQPAQQQNVSSRRSPAGPAQTCQANGSSGTGVTQEAATREQLDAAWSIRASPAGPAIKPSENSRPGLAKRDRGQPDMGQPAEPQQARRHAEPAPAFSSFPHLFLLFPSVGWPILFLFFFFPAGWLFSFSSGSSPPARSSSFFQLDGRGRQPATTTSEATRRGGRPGRMAGGVRMGEDASRPRRHRRRQGPEAVQGVRPEECPWARARRSRCRPTRAVGHAR